MFSGPWSCRHRVRFFACVIGAILHASLVKAHLWPLGRVIISDVDPVLAKVASTAFDDIERKTLVSFVHKKANATGPRSLALRSVSHPSAPGSSVVDLCCFDTSTASQRQLSLALLRSLGLDLDASMLGNKTAVGLRPTEAEAVNRLYAAEVLPDASKLPALVPVGVWQLAPGRKAGADWSSMIGGRGRRVVSGTSRWAARLKANGLLPGVIGAIPTFTFRGNKAQVLLLGEECAEVLPGAALLSASIKKGDGLRRAELPPPPSSEGLGAGIQRAMSLARSKGFVGGMPTHLADGSVLAFRSSCARVASMSTVGETPESIFAEHRSAIALARVARWAQGQGALYGVPSFAQLISVEKGSAQDAEVVLVHFIEKATSEPLTHNTDRGTPLTTTLMLAGMCSGMTFLACHWFKKHGRAISQAERDLEFVVDSL